ncbi:MAG TPA: hypothetical protein VF676_02215 [Flavobacterium sp.]|jgi:hypothetical protein
MATKVGIYITGLGQSYTKESVEKYAIRMVNELSFTSSAAVYEIKTEKVFYSDIKESTCVTIVKHQGSLSNTIYKLYDFQYHEILTEKFKRNNILIKSLILFGLVVRKLPQLFMRLFKRGDYDRPYQTFYAFVILFIISFSIVFLIPATIDMMPLDISITKGIKDVLKATGITLHDPDYDVSIFLDKLRKVGKAMVPVTTFILLIVPESKTILTTMATEFACVDRYIRNGEQSQVVLGNLDLLMEFVAEREPDSQLHIHSYSFGSIVATDLLFPLGSIPTKNTLERIELLVTVGNPYEFVNAYYPKFFKGRCQMMDEKLKWANIYSIADALATNFRKDTGRGEAEFGLTDNKIIPHNLNFETAPDRGSGFFNFFSLHSLSVHKCYWDSSPSGQSCVRIIIKHMMENDFIKN